MFPNFHFGFDRVDQRHARGWCRRDLLAHVDDDDQFQHAIETRAHVRLRRARAASRHQGARRSTSDCWTAILAMIACSSLAKLLVGIFSGRRAARIDLYCFGISADTR